jgi:hypothetical protein
MQEPDLQPLEGLDTLSLPGGDAESCPFCDLYNSQEQSRNYAKDQKMLSDHFEAGVHELPRDESKSREAALYCY